MNDEDREMYTRLGISRWRIFYSEAWALWREFKWFLFTGWRRLKKWYFSKIAGKEWPSKK